MDNLYYYCKLSNLADILLLRSVMRVVPSVKLIYHYGLPDSTSNLTPPFLHPAP